MTPTDVSPALALIPTLATAAAPETGDGAVLERDPGMPSSTWLARNDAWEYLRFAVKRLASGSDGPGTVVPDSEIFRNLRALETIEMYWAGFGRRYVAAIAELLRDGDFATAFARIDRVTGRLRTNGVLDDPTEDPEEADAAAAEDANRPRFEVLVVDDTTPAERDAMRADVRRLRSGIDAFTYDFVIVPSVDDAIAAVLTNPNILACVVRPGFRDRTAQLLSPDLRESIDLARTQVRADTGSRQPLAPIQRVLDLADTLGAIRPELDLYLSAGAHIEDLAGALTRRFRRVFRREDQLELHLTLLRRISHLYDTPFFSAIQDHARRPVGVFHALPVARGGSVVSSRWIRDFADFYGLNLLLAETSATSGGLDSLLAPVATLKKAQELAARAFGAKHTFFVTNGTSTANKIVHQALAAPGDVVLVDRNCHKSHHHALMLTGARAAYLEAYPLNDVAFYGAVPLSRIKQLLLDYRAAGRLDEVRMITLTNCTFDGIVYDPERVMAECLAIKPDLVFLWDEAWFAFAAFHPVMRRRTAMAAAAQLDRRMRSAAYAREYREQRERLFDPATGEPRGDDVWLAERLLPSPDARVRVYATQSTHKTLTALRQGSMIHVYDQDWARDAEESFHEAYMTHTSTSPNYQILASLDLGRRQVELEGFELVQRQIDLATNLARMIARHPLLRRTFRVLTAHDLVPADLRGGARPMPHRDGLAEMWRAWESEEFVIDPSRITIEISRTGVDGDTFKHEHLMDRYGIQVNKTSRNTVLFMTNIGTSRSAIAYLIEVLVKLAERFDEEQSQRDTAIALPEEAPMPPLPDFSAFAPGYASGDALPDGDLRTAFFDGQRRDALEHVSPEELLARIDAGAAPVSGGFVTPYPPGFPVLVPGQVITREVLEFMSALDTREIHGFDPRRGYRVFRSEG